MNAFLHDETPAGACITEPERWTTTADDEEKVICRSCPRWWVCARDACANCLARKGCGPEYTYPRRDVDGRLLCGNSSHWPSATATRCGNAASATPRAPDPQPVRRLLSGGRRRTKLNQDAVQRDP